jgi:UDPglucose 6-dehydrogenase
MQTTILGGGYVGLVTAACLAHLGHSVTIIEPDPDRLEPIRRGAIPIHEPDLAGLVAQAVQSSALRALPTMAEATGATDIVLMCVGTPLRSDSEPDLGQVEAASRAIHVHAGAAPIVIRSTLPLGATQQVAAWTARDDLTGLVTNPEFLRQGSAVADFLKPTRIVVGSDGGRETQTVQLVRDLYAGIVAPFIVTDYASAEMIKNASNAYLATKLSFVNEVADLCEAYGANVADVIHGMGLDPRIGSSYMSPGIGFGGSCLPKELANMVRLGRQRGLDTPLMAGAARTNELRAGRIADRLEALRGPLAGCRVAILGLTFKPDTDDTRYSPAIALADELLRRGARVAAHDPVLPTDSPAVPPAVERAETPESAISAADLVLLATAWPQYLALDWKRLSSSAATPIVFDGRGVLDRSTLASAGWTVLSVGIAHGEPVVEPVTA